VIIALMMEAVRTTKILTTFGSVVLEKPIVAKLDKKFGGIYVTLRFMDCVHSSLPLISLLK
jgi:hypothetical protein